MKRPADSPSRRFHWRARDGRKLRRWETQAWSALFSNLPEVRLWAASFCDGIKRVYQSRSISTVKLELAWLTAPRGDYLGDFENLCEAIGLDPEDVRRDVLSDVQAGRIAATVVA